VRKERPEASPFRHPRGVHDVSLARNAPPIKRREGLADPSPSLQFPLHSKKRPSMPCRSAKEELRMPATS
jgi:hypothetical protein